MKHRVAHFGIFAAFLFGAIRFSFAWLGEGGGTDYSRYAPSSYYCSNNGTSVTSQAGISVSSPTLALYNPINSGVYLTIIDVGVDITAAPAAAASLFLTYNVAPSSAVMLTPGAAGTLATVTPALIGKSSTTALGVCTIQGFLPTLPKAFRYLGGTTGAAAIGGVSLTDITAGKVVIPPGGLVSIQSTSAAAMIAHFLWREDPH